MAEKPKDTTDGLRRERLETALHVLAAFSHHGPSGVAESDRQKLTSWAESEHERQMSIDDLARSIIDREFARRAGATWG